MAETDPGDPRKVSLASAAAGLREFWSQQVVGTANGQLLKVAKGIGATTWHAHDDQDEVFLVLRGSLVVQTHSGDVLVRSGEMLVVPRGVEHRPVAEEEVLLMLIGSGITSTAEGGKPAWSRGGGTP